MTDSEAKRRRKLVALMGQLAEILDRNGGRFTGTVLLHCNGGHVVELEAREKMKARTGTDVPLSEVEGG